MPVIIGDGLRKPDFRGVAPLISGLVRLFGKHPSPVMSPELEGRK